MRKLLAAMVLVLVMQPGLAQEKPLDGNYMLKACAAHLALVEDRDADFLWSELGGYSAGFCSGFVHGSGEAHKNLDPKVCTPDSVTNGQMIRVYMTYLKWNPELLHKDAGELLHWALLEFFACE